MAAVVPLVAHHRLSERFLRVDLTGDASVAGLACAIETVRRCRGTWRTRNLLIDLRTVRHGAVNVPTALGEQLLHQLPDVGRVACLQSPGDAHQLRFGPSIRFYVDEADALHWVKCEPERPAGEPRANAPRHSWKSVAALARLVLHPGAVAALFLGRKHSA